jgi:predicted nucleotide-binding protein (sugar kinase/HSP70/actin superfamily)
MKAKKKLYDLEKKQREISEKLDKFDYSYNKEQKKVNDINEILDKDNNGNFESCAKMIKITKKY